MWLLLKKEVSYAQLTIFLLLFYLLGLESCLWGAIENKTFIF
jgi:hypothetical protein